MRLQAFVVIMSLAVLTQAVSDGVANNARLPPWFSPEVIAAGSWTEDASLVNRGDLRLRFHFEDVSPWLDFKLRGEVMDKRDAQSPSEDGLTFFGAGLYHSITSSRVLYGPLAVTGLPARVKNIWAHGASFVGTHTALSADLRTEPAATAKPALFAQLWSPPVFGIKVFAAYTSDIDKGQVPGASPLGYSAGAEAAFTKKTKLAAEVYSQDLTLAERKADGWFSDKTALPERKSRIYAGTASFLSPYISVAGDFAYSEPFAFGRGAYWNCGLQLGDKPWRVSLAADRTTQLFVDGGGAIPEQGFRTGARFELFRKRNELWKVQTTLRGYKQDDDRFTRSTTTIYYRFPLAAKRSDSSIQVVPTRISLSETRDATNAEKVLDSWTVAFGFNLWRLRSGASFSLDEYSHDDDPLPFPDPRSTYTINAWKLGLEASTSFSFLTLTAKSGLNATLDAQTAVWNAVKIPFSFALRAQALPGRLTLKAESPAFPSDWNFAISWRLQI
jgi:hypothetical protein